MSLPYLGIKYLEVKINQESPEGKNFLAGGELLAGERRSTRPLWPVSFMPVSVRSAWRMRQASMRCA